MVNFFIDRPIFAWVIAIVIMLAGGLATLSLPIAQYPEIAPPVISISVTYPGASAETVQSTVVQIIEQQLSGLDDLRYFSSEGNKDGSMQIELTFEQGTDPDIAQVQVQNKLSLAAPQLPIEVQQQGIRVSKGALNFFMIVGFVSTDDSMNQAAISDFIVSTVQDPLSRTPGVGDYQTFGSAFAMRIWLDPARLNGYALTPVDVNNAISSQNVQVSSGEIGGLPAVPGHQLNATVIGSSRLQTVEEFKQILLRVNQDGSQVRLRDVARIELGGESDSITTLFNAKQASGIGIRLASGANALDTADAVRATLDRLRPQLPPGLDIVYPYDTTPFVRLSIEEVVWTLGEAIVLVFLIMLLFLQNLRATFVPTIAVPVVLLGTLGVLAVSGFTINTLTMFGMVLAIGLLVDDAIVVVENVERVMAEEGLTPKEATRKSMTQITGALVGIAMVLSAVFLPMAFFGGSTGVIYRQFSITIATAMALSVIVALVFTPALCATLLKPVQHALARRGRPARANARRLRVAHPLLRVVQPRLRRQHPPLRGRRAADARTARPLHAGLRRPRRGAGRAVHPDPDRVPARRGPGRHVLRGQNPAGRHSRPYGTGARRRPRLCGHRGEGRHQLHPGDLRIQLQRTRPERRPRLRHAQGLGRAAGRADTTCSRSPAASMRVSPTTRMPPSSPPRRRRSPSWATPPALTSCCRTGPVSAMTRSWPRAISCSTWPGRARC